MTASHNSAADLPKSWDPGAMESAIYQTGWTPGYFTADPSSAKPEYSIVLPPPNVTGSLHMGHALEHTMMDALTRRKRMQGYEVLWQPGMDHAGIATQSVVEKQLAVDGKTKEDFGRELFVEQGVGLEARVRRRHRRPDAPAGRRGRLEPRPVHHGRGPVAGGARPFSSGSTTPG